MKRKQRIILLLVVFWAVIVGVPGVWLWQADRQERLNRQLISAIKRDDTPAALSALEQGATANARDEAIIPLRETIWNLVRRRRLLPPTQDTALFVFLTSPLTKDDAFSDRTVRKERLQLVRALLEHGASVNVTDEQGNGPLFYALLYSNPGVVQLLVERGACANARITADALLSAIAYQDDASTVELILDHGADPNLVRFAHTPLGLAVERRKAAAVRCLLRHNADPNALQQLDYVAARPLAYAEQNHLTEIAKLLREAGARR